jgi:hypothetical protein
MAVPLALVAIRIQNGAMSLSREVTVWCDNCTHWEQASAPAAKLRRKLKAEGWRQEKTKDFCPTCAAARDECLDLQ